jgi:outer membrane protein OmpA-like peptidoglycan-associated protein
VDVKKRAQNKDKAAEKRYQAAIQLAQDIWGQDPAFKDSVAKAEDVDGLISDANFVGLPGNESFFRAKGNLSGFDFKQKQALRLPADPSKDPPKKDPTLFVAGDLDYAALRELGDLHGKAPMQGRIVVEGLKIEPEKKIYSFEIKFKPDQSDFPATEYGEHFQRALELASLYGNTVVAVRGHADPSALVQRFLEAAESQGLIKAKGNGFVVAATGKAFDPKDIKQVLEFIKNNPRLEYRDEGRSYSMAGSVTVLQDLSVRRSEEVKKTILKYAGDRTLLLDTSQFQVSAAGVNEPKAVALDGQVNPDNRRVEFSIIKVPAEKVNAEEFVQ